ncbi:hypothetical protein EJB05_39693, partial [Eragrostis curvula]
GDASAPFHQKKDYASAVLRRDPFARRGLLPRSESAAPGGTDDASSARSQNKDDVNSYSFRQQVLAELQRIDSAGEDEDKDEDEDEDEEEEDEDDEVNEDGEVEEEEKTEMMGGETWFSSEIPVYQDYLKCINRAEFEEDLPEGILTVSLLKHQGMGKTISMMALIQKEMPQQSEFRSSSKTAGGTLVVCPKKILLQWKEEFATRVTESAKLSILVYYNYRGPRAPDPEQLVQADVVLTTYDTLKQQSGTIANIKWFRVVLDEAHTIRNNTVIDGEAIVTLPEKTIQMKGICFTTEERDIYSSIRGKRHWQRLDVEKDSLSKCIYFVFILKGRWKLRKSSFSEMKSKVMELRKACNHTCLVSRAMKKSKRKSNPERSYVPSKIKAVMEILNSLVAESENAPEKALVFCYFHETLDLLELQLKNAYIQYRRIDGSLLLDSGDKAVKDFNKKPEVRVLLLSLMSGSLGLNLVAASHVILVEPWWNPYVEKQAIGRAHRITQTRPVIVHRLYIKDTVEERILFLQKRKEDIIKRVFDGDIFGDPARLKELTKLTIEDTRYLLGTDSYPPTSMHGSA